MKSGLRIRLDSSRFREGCMGRSQGHNPTSSLLSAQPPAPSWGLTNENEMCDLTASAHPVSVPLFSPSPSEEILSCHSKPKCAVSKAEANNASNASIGSVIKGSRNILPAR